MAQINPRTFAVANQLGDGIYELILTNWGNRGQLQDPQNGSINYPPVFSTANGSIPILGTAAAPAKFTLPLLPSLFGIAIAPRSNVDRCILNYTTLPQASPLQSQVAPADAFVDGFVNQGGILETEQILSVQSPLIGQQVGPIIVRACEAHWFGDSYFPDGSATASGLFGTAIPSRKFGDTALWTNPELRLLLYLTSRGVLPPASRAPFHLTGIHHFTAGGEETLVIVPVMGRHHVRVSFRAGSNPAAVRVAGTFHQTTGAAGPAFATSHDYEVPLAEPVTVPAQQAVVFSCSLDHPSVSFLIVYSTGGFGAGTDVEFSVDAFD